MLRMVLIDNMLACPIGSHERRVHALDAAQAVQLVVCGKKVGVWDAGDDVGVGFEGVVARVGDVDEA